MSEPKPPNKITSLRHLWPFIKPYKARFLIAFILLTLGSITILLVPIVFRDLIDFGFGQAPVEQQDMMGSLSLNQRFIVLACLAIFWAIIVSTRYYSVSWIGERVTADIRNAIYSNMLAQSPQFFETLQTGEVLSRLTGDTTLIQTVVGSSISMGLRSLFQSAGGMIMLAVTSWYLFSLNLLLMIVMAIPIFLLGRKVKKLSRETQDRIADASALAGEILNATTTVQAFTRERWEVDRFKSRTETSFVTAINRTRIRAVLSAVIITAIMGSIIFVIWIGHHLVISGYLTNGQLISFILYAFLVASGAATIAEVWGDLMKASGASERLFELLQTENPILNKTESQNFPVPDKAELRFHQVKFRYPSRPNCYALQNIDLIIRPGERVALVGQSGAGKSTIFQLLLRFYETSEGYLLFNNVDIRNIPLQQLRRSIAIVPQDPVIFSDNILENIRYGRPDATDSDVLAAAGAAQVDEFVKHLPDTYDTFLGERGTRLSGGQRQRIAIARAILKNAPLLLLDEATSALDMESELLVQEGLNAAMKGKTTLIIAHRLATVKKVDRIIVLDQGHIIEFGTPDELRNKKGLYAKFANLQFEL